MSLASRVRIPRQYHVASPEGSKKKERRQRGRSRSPSPVQRSFSFPDDIADEEAFATRELAGPEVVEEPQQQSLRAIPIPRVSSITDFRRSVSSLPPVQEEGSEDETAKHRHTSQHRSRDLSGSPDVNRDSGFITSSPHLSKGTLHDQGIRDSGVHLKDWPEVTTPKSTPKQRDMSRFESPSARRSTGSIAEDEPHARLPEKDKLLRRSPVGERDLRDKVKATGTPRLREPSPPPHTPEPGKLSLKKRNSKHSSQQPPEPSSSLTSSMTRSRIKPGAYRITAPEWRGSLASPASPETPFPRRSASNTSIVRLRTPEPLNLRPDSPGSIRSYTGTPPLRRIDKRSVSGDLRSVSLSQRKDEKKEGGGEARAPATATSQTKDFPAGAALIAGAAAALGAAELLSRAAQNNTPVANEGRVRARDMTDVYVSLLRSFLFPSSSTTDAHGLSNLQFLSPAADPCDSRMATARAASAPRALRLDLIACVDDRVCRSSSLNPALNS